METEAGHLFERRIAAELSMLSKGESKLYSRIQELWKGGGALAPDPLIFGQPFEYKSVICSVVWRARQVCCVAELSRDNGKRKVDVVFPLFLRVNGSNKSLKSMCKLKKEYKSTDLWSLCWNFFQEMKDLVEEEEDVVACLMALESFLSTEPQPSPQKKPKTSAHDACKSCLAMMKSNPRFILFDNVKQNSMLPLGLHFERG